MRYAAMLADTRPNGVLLAGAGNPLCNATSSYWADWFFFSICY